METFLTILEIIMINIILSGDNAIVIAMATRSLPKEMQNKALGWGTGFAVIARIILAAVVVIILEIPYIHAIAGILLAYIAWGVLKQHDEEHDVDNKKVANSVGKAIITIAVADITMSLDNVVAVAGAAGGHMGLLILGIAISIPLMVFGSKFLVGLMAKYPIIIYAGAGILAWTAGEMIIEDEKLTALLHISHTAGYFIAGILTVGIVLGGYLKNKKAEKNKGEDKVTA